MDPLARIRDDLLEVLARRALTEDSARPEAVARRHGGSHGRGGRTARENIADLVDPGSFVEYGRYVTAAQEARRPLDELLDRTVADGIVGGIATVDGRSCAVLSYDYLVMAGTQGMRGHRKTDRLLELVERMRLPVVFFTEGGGGRPGDTDMPLVSALDVDTFRVWGRLAGVAPRIAVVHGSCFAGNAVLAGASDLIIATRSSSLGMAGPAMIAGGGLGDVAAADIGPIHVQTANGVVDVAVEDEEEAVEVARHLLGLLAAPTVEDWCTPDQTTLRNVVPEREQTAYDVHPVIETLADEDSLVLLRDAYAQELVTALGRVEGRTVGFMANQTLHSAGAITAGAAEKGTRFLELCDTFGVPVVSLVDTPGMMVGPEAEATGLVRHASRLVVAGAKLRVPLVGVVLRRGYGLGAQAMLGGSTHAPLATVAWPGAHLGAMGIEGAVRLALRKELAGMGSDEEREDAVRQLVAAERERAKALNVARFFEIDDVIDPAETRQVIAAVLTAATAD
ncbi:MAG TPA: carboxyl transferase domain-containing protein [Nocardioidaceae bacterium]|nr:carboxyl transferase domain-containing protein [Nocardioidaceae bacterium]